MSLCTRNRWGTGSSSSGSYAPKQTTQESNSNEMEDKFKKMIADRAKQDNIWTAPIQQEVSNPANAKKELK